jgi:hypothetical protein
MCFNIFNLEVCMKRLLTISVAVFAFGMFTASANAESRSAPDGIAQGVELAGDRAASRAEAQRDATLPQPAVPVIPNSGGVAANPNDPIQHDRNNSFQGASGHSGEKRDERSTNRESIQAQREREMNRAYNR